MSNGEIAALLCLVIEVEFMRDFSWNSFFLVSPGAEKGAGGGNDLWETT